MPRRSVYSRKESEPATIDYVMREAGRFPMGPFALMDLIGNDVNFAVTESVFNGFYQNARFAPSLYQQALVEAGFVKPAAGFTLTVNNPLRVRRRWQRHSPLLKRCD